MFKQISAREIRLLPVYVYGSESLAHQVYIKREKDMMLHSQFSFCRSGSGIFTDHNGDSREVHAGDVLYFQPSAPNSYAPVTPVWGLDYIVCGGEALVPYTEALGFSKSGVISLSAENAKTSGELFSQIIRINNGEYENSHTICSRLLYRLIWVMGSQIKSTDASSEKKRRMIEPCIDYINSNYMNDISIAHLAESIGVTPTYLGIIFRDIYHTTPQKYLINVRVESAKRLLSESSAHGLEYIARMCGFNSTSYLCNTFKRYAGMTPDEYRRANTYADMRHNFR